MLPALVVEERVPGGDLDDRIVALREAAERVRRVEARLEEQMREDLARGPLARRVRALQVGVHALELAAQVLRGRIDTSLEGLARSCWPLFLLHRGAVVALHELDARCPVRRPGGVRPAVEAWGTRAAAPATDTPAATAPCQGPRTTADRPFPRWRLRFTAMAEGCRRAPSSRFSISTRACSGFTAAVVVAGTVVASLHASNCSIVTGSSRTRTPVAWCTASVMAAAMPARPISPIPRAPECVDLLVGEVEEMHLDRRHVGVHRHHVVGQVAVDRRAGLRDRTTCAPAGPCRSPSRPRPRSGSGRPAG